MKKYIYLFVIIAFACSPAKIRTSYDQNIDFARYETWCWLRGCELVYEGPNYLYDSAMIESIGNAIAIEMYEKGFVQTDDNADLMLDYHIVIKEDSAIFARVHEEDLPYWSDYEQDYYHFLKGTLVLDVIDRERGQVIWRSSAERYMALFPEMDDKLIKRSIHHLMKKFPPNVPQEQK